MDNRLHDLIEKIKHLERELATEIQRSEEDFLYKILGKRITFEEAARVKHQAQVTGLIPFLLDSSWLNILSAPLVWLCLPPALLLDLLVTLYQAVCFPIYGIPKARRGDYIVMDRSQISYLNAIEKLNCAFCSYFNGLIAFVQEVAGRTEQYWCPIKHARKIGTLHSRYLKFLDYGDAEGYRQRLEAVRRDFDDLRS